MFVRFSFSTRNTLLKYKTSIIVFQQPSPRKKPRKQTLSSNSVRPGSEQQWGSSENDGTEVVKRKMAKNLSNRMQENSGNQSGMHHRTISPPPRKPSSNYIKDKPHMSLLNR